MLRRFSINFAIFSMFLDFVCVVSSLSLSYTIRPWLNSLSFIRPIPDTIDWPYALFILFPIFSVGIFSIFSIYDGRKNWRVVDEFAILSVATFISSICLAGILYLTYREVSRAAFIVFVFISYVLYLTWRCIARFAFRMQKYLPDSVRRIVIVGAGSLGQSVRKQLEETPTNHLVGFVDDEEDQYKQNGLTLLGKVSDLDVVIEKYNISDVIMALPHSMYQMMYSAVNRISEAPVKVWVALGFFDLALYKTGIEDFAGIPMIDLRAPALSEYQRFIKRIFDVVFAILMLIPALPIMAIIALTIVLGSGRPVFFCQKRIGENGRLFDVYKFRTMVKDAENLRDHVERIDGEGNVIHKTGDDPRITRVGRILRRLSLDELPQLVNVLAGTMSIVGPRPELPHLVEKYQSWQRKRFAVPPGITGWWQVNGRSDRIMHLHTEDDLYYINNYSLWLDFLILLRTVWTVILGKGAY